MEALSNVPNGGWKVAQWSEAEVTRLTTRYGENWRTHPVVQRMARRKAST